MYISVALITGSEVNVQNTADALAHLLTMSDIPLPLSALVSKYIISSVYRLVNYTSLEAGILSEARTGTMAANQCIMCMNG